VFQERALSTEDIKIKREVLIMWRKILAMAIPILCILLATQGAVAADYPSKPITLINAWAPGGTLDIQARAFAALSDKYLGQPIAVVNKPGASGMIGGRQAAQATPDGYTLTVGSSNNTCAIEWEIANGRKPAFVRGDFTTIGSFTMSPALVVVPLNSPWMNLADLIRDAKANPGRYAFSSGGLYQGSHIPAELLMKAAGFKARHVPTTGGGPALTAVVGGHVDFATQFPSTSIPLAEGKKLRILAVQGSQRIPAIPDIPTVKELGIDAEWYLWVGILTPKKTPVEVVRKLREATDKIAKDPVFLQTIEKTGDKVRYMNGEELAKFWDLESDKLAKVYAQMPKDSEK
jgi:tripartite-type tricarboxylate transporter receptor subunit TctC